MITTTPLCLIDRKPSPSFLLVSNESAIHQINKLPRAIKIVSIIYSTILSFFPK